MAGLEPFLLGPPRLERDGVPLQFDTRKIMALVAYLTVSSLKADDRHLSRDSLLALLSPELEPSRARAVLRRNLSVLRSALEGEIRQSLDFLETDLRDVPLRQRSLRAVFDHSWRLLDEREREVFRGLSVFLKGFTREAAQALVGASLRELTSLSEKSLLRPSSPGRYETGTAPTIPRSWSGGPGTGLGRDGRPACDRAITGPSHRCR